MGDEPSGRYRRRGIVGVYHLERQVIVDVLIQVQQPVLLQLHQGG